MTQLQTRPAFSSAADAAPPTVDIAVPVYNERKDLEMAVRRLRRFLDRRFPLAAVVTIVDNASDDGTWAVADRLRRELDGVRALHLDAKGRGRALKAAWTASDAEVVAYMDVDLSTDLDALFPLVASLLSGHSDIAIGSRLAPGARTVRGAKREAVSRIYNFLLRALLGARFSDAQCGFKALRAEDARLLLPHVADNEWFFDTEMLLLAQHNGLRAHEVPVDWSDDPDSRVDVARTAAADLRGMVRMAWALATGRGRVPELRDRRVPSQGVTRAGAHGPIGLLSYLVLFLVLRKATSLWMANFFSLAAVSVAAGVTHLLPRLTRRSSGYPGMSPSVAALGSSCAYLALTTLCLLTAQAVFPGSWVGEVVAISLGAALGAAARSLALRALAFRSYLLSAGSQRALSPARAQRATMR